uniref:NADH-ubiquinone oxidoreductase chain 2 n=1 Tax=Placida sp. 1 NY-2013 TaxID=1281821 RepID=L7V0B3_9GAST|nr:NADH dehydrogenase subunit 2 [Placida sp. 1 NY-2013]AGC56267.1 NADH dehydrogenase subunit 2 [Placida sp. 1 NY-2013]
MSSANLLFLSLLLSGPLVSVSSSNWIVCWGGVELSFLGLIPLLFLSNKYISLTKESAMKYFCIQALGSAILFYGGLMTFSCVSEELTSLLLVFSIFVKLGVFPMHFWVPSVVAGLDWVPLYLILTIQKIAPFAFMSLVITNISDSMSSIILILGGMTSVVGAFIGNNQTDLRAMLGASSIAHSGWLVLGVMTGYFWGYFSIYCLSLFFAFYFLSFPTSSSEAGMGILSLSGLPPFFMFLGKWGILKMSVESLVPMWLMSLFLLGAVISLGFYLKFSYSFVLNSNGSIWFTSNKNMCLVFITVNFFALLFFFLV